MAPTTAVVVSGPLLASLLYEQWSADADLEALLVGEVQTTTTETMSDDDIAIRHTHTRYRVHSFRVLPTQFSFYTPLGAVDYPALERVMGADLPRVVGWLRFRRNTPPVVYARESAVHEDLCRRLGRTCVLWIATGALATPEGATHDLDYIAVAPTAAPTSTTGGWSCPRVPIEVLNLVESTQAAYSSFVPAGAPLTSGLGASERLHTAFSKISIANVVAQLQGVQGELQALVTDRLASLWAAQQKLVAVRAEVDALEARKLAKEQAAAAAAAPVPPPYLGETLPPDGAAEAPEAPGTSMDSDGPLPPPPAAAAAAAAAADGAGVVAAPDTSDSLGRSE